MLYAGKEYAYVLMLGALLLSLESQAYHSESVLNRLSPYSLNRYARKVHTQSGEDGIIEEIFKRLNVQEGFCVEFGAYDGITISNTRYLWEQGWSGVSIEASAGPFEKLQKLYNNQPRMVCINAFVLPESSATNGRTFDEIAREFFPNKEIDFLSIDIDGADYLILESLECKPKVICIEGGFCWHPLLNTRIPDNYALQNLQQPLSIMTSIANAKGYTPICMEGGNLFLIRDDLSHFFSQVPQDALTLWRDGWRSLPQKSRDHILNWRKNHAILHRFEGDLCTQMPITNDF